MVLLAAEERKKMSRYWFYFIKKGCMDGIYKPYKGVYAKSELDATIIVKGLLTPPYELIVAKTVRIG